MAIGPAGKWYSQLALAGVLAALIVRRSGDRRAVRGAAAILASGALAGVAVKLFDHVLPQPPVPAGRANRNKAVFPSGHTLAPTAVAITAAYVAVREGWLDRGFAIPLAAAFPMVTASGKLFGQKHWLSDVAGGYSAGIAIAASVLAAYEAVTPE